MLLDKQHHYLRCTTGARCIAAVHRNPYAFGLSHQLYRSTLVNFRPSAHVDTNTGVVGFAEACTAKGIYDKRAPMANTTTPQELEATFHTWKDALNKGDLKTFWQAIDDRAEILDEDFPWRMSKEDFVDHLNFHAGERPLWESFEWRPRELHFLVVGDTGHVSGFATFRGKPRDAGFRQRFMGFTQTWVRQAGNWQLLCWHQSPLLGRIVGSSPS